MPDLPDLPCWSIRVLLVGRFANVVVLALRATQLELRPAARSYQLLVAAGRWQASRQAAGRPAGRPTSGQMGDVRWEMGGKRDVSGQGCGQRGARPAAASSSLSSGQRPLDRTRPWLRPVRLESPLGPSYFFSGLKSSGETQWRAQFGAVRRRLSVKRPY